MASCKSWRTQPGSLPDVLAHEELNDDRELKEIRVTLSSGEKVTVRSPTIVGDSLVGLGPRKEIGASDKLAIAQSDVRNVEIRVTSVAKTTALVVGVGFGVLLVASAIAAAADDPPESTGDFTSCPLVYSWDGREWQLDSGTFGGAIMAPLARSDVDNLEHARSHEGVLRLRLTNELDEVDFVDAIEILAVDHDPGVSVSPGADGRLYTLGSSVPATNASDYDGREVLSRVTERDGWSWESMVYRRDLSSAEENRDGIEVEFPRPERAASARLILDAHNTPWAAYLIGEYVRAHGRDTRHWYAALEAEPERARQLGERFVREAFLEVKVLTSEGWMTQGFAWEAGPEVVKRQVIPLDLSTVVGETVRVRLEAPPSFWLVDYVAIDYSPEHTITVHTLAPRQALGRDGGDVRDLLATVDDRYYEMVKGDEAELIFDVPLVPEGEARSYLLRSTGWYKINSPGTGEPDVELLRMVEQEPGAIARIAVARQNAAIEMWTDE
jgi:hypothetical protein